MATAASFEGVTRMSDRSSGISPATTRGLTEEKDEPKDGETVADVSTLEVFTGGGVATTSTEAETLGTDDVL